MSFTPQFPRPDNEVERDYASGSNDRNELDRYLASREVVDIPAVIGGKKIFSDDVEEIRAPHDHKRVIARLHRPRAEDVREAIAGSLSVAHEWATMAFADRAAIMHRAAAIITGRERHRINAATMLGQSKTLAEAEPDSACELIDFLRFNSYHAQKIYNEQPLTTRNAQNTLDWRPLEGFVYAVSPFNFTAIGANLCCAPAVMGNTVLWKPSNKSALANYIFYEALLEAGLPDNVINFVPGDPVMVTDEVLASPHLAGIHFTGSSHVFRSLWKRVGENINNFRTFPRLVGETGGKDFVLAHSSANADEVAVALVSGAFGYQGQKCSAASRAYIPQSLWPSVKEKLVSIVGGLKVGDVADADTYMGAVIDQHSYQKLASKLEMAAADDTVEIVVGGSCSDEVGYFIDPTVLLVADPQHQLMKEELFGPVLTVYVYDDSKWDDMLDLVDSTTEYALTGSMFITDRRALVQAQDRLRNAVGNLYVNDKPTGAMVGQQPFGGGRSSGTNDKAGSWMNLLRWTSPRTVKESFAVPRDW